MCVFGPFFWGPHKSMGKNDRRGPAHFVRISHWTLQNPKNEGVDLTPFFSLRVLVYIDLQATSNFKSNDS